MSKNKLDYQTKEVANIFDEASLWAAPFGQLMLENIPMKPASVVLDIGFGTGYPLIELGQRFGAASKVYGIDIWKSGILRAQEKIRVLDLDNVQIFEQDAVSIPLASEEVDLVCSNLGVNNFAQKELVLQEVFRVLKTGGHLCITTNPIGTFAELFQVFAEVIQEMNLPESETALKNYIEHRGTEASIIREMETAGFQRVKIISDSTQMRFMCAEALFDHSLMRIGFAESWEKLVPASKLDGFFAAAKIKITKQIKETGSFKITIPMLYVEVRK